MHKEGTPDLGAWLRRCEVACERPGGRSGSVLAAQGRGGALAGSLEVSANSHLHPSFRPAGLSWQGVRELGRRAATGRQADRAPAFLPQGSGGGHLGNNISDCCFWVHWKCENSPVVGIVLRRNFAEGYLRLGKKGLKNLGGGKGTSRAPGLCLPWLTWV